MSQSDLSDKSKKDTAVSLGGTMETLLHRENYFYDITTKLIAKANLLQWQEFLSSVKAGEVFSFDEYGTIATPDNVKSVTLDGDPTYVREGITDYFRISFRVREA